VTQFGIASGQSRPSPPAYQIGNRARVHDVPFSSISHPPIMTSSVQPVYQIAMRHQDLPNNWSSLIEPNKEEHHEHTE
jgi:hypothetical protein